jgi:hypothetical protein
MRIDIIIGLIGGLLVVVCQIASMWLQLDLFF